MKKFGMICLRLACLAAAVAAISAVVMLLWNWVVPAVTGWAALKYWQAIVILVLAKILCCGGHGHKGPHGHCGPKGCCGHHRPDKETREAMMAFRQKMASMSEEERVKFLKEKLASISDEGPKNA